MYDVLREPAISSVNTVSLCLMMTKKAHLVAETLANLIDEAVQADPQGSGWEIDESLFTANESAFTDLQVACREMQDAAARLRPLITKWTEKRGEFGYPVGTTGA